jgi:hypothetical protein
MTGVQLQLLVGGRILVPLSLVLESSQSHCQEDPLLTQEQLNESLQGSCWTGETEVSGAGHCGTFVHV